jgi:hypothetical protein
MTIRRRTFALMLALTAAGGAAADLRAQQTHVSSVVVPVTGSADAGGRFAGTLFIQQFVAQGNTIAVIGTVSGSLSTATGVTRNLVTQVTMPLDIAASIARQNTDAVLAQASCDLLHLEVGSTTLNALGSTIALDPSAFDIVSAIQSATGPALSAANTTVQPGGTTASALPVTTSTTPGVFTTTATAAQTRNGATQSQLGSLLCSVGGLRSSAAANRAELALLLNQILAMLG